MVSLPAWGFDSPWPPTSPPPLRLSLPAWPLRHAVKVPPDLLCLPSPGLPSIQSLTLPHWAPWSHSTNTSPATTSLAQRPAFIYASGLNHSGGGWEGPWTPNWFPLLGRRSRGGSRVGLSPSPALPGQQKPHPLSSFYQKVCTTHPSPSSNHSLLPSPFRSNTCPHRWLWLTALSSVVWLHPAHIFINSPFNLLSLKNANLNESPVPAGFLTDRPFEEVEWYGWKANSSGLGKDIWSIHSTTFM